jgi:hypothetical protein
MRSRSAGLQSNAFLQGQPLSFRLQMALSIGALDPIVPAQSSVDIDVITDITSEVKLWSTAIEGTNV